MPDWNKFTERQICKAYAEGQFDALEGAGRPLPYRPGDALIDPGVAVGHRIMAQAGALPRELTLKAELDAAFAAWNGEVDPTRKRAQMARIADLQLRYEIEREARQAFMKG